ncbi:MAG: SIR2 family protein [Bacteroidetes bacterium]|nr:SIR2 family protein [Bacteroidota bacterium]
MAKISPERAYTIAQGNALGTGNEVMKWNNTRAHDNSHETKNSRKTFDMQLTERQWKTLVKDLQQQRCILLLGDRISVAADGQSERLSVLLARHLGKKMEAEEVAFEADQATNLAYMAQRFLSIPRTRRIDLEDEVTEFFSSVTRQIPEHYRKLADLPFHIAVNLSPDDYLLRAWKAAGKKDATTAHYNFKGSVEEDVVSPVPSRPLLYNLLGTLGNPESLVLTQEDRVDFIKNVLRDNPSIPNAVASHFGERKTYIFLGFNLENWDYRLLFDTLLLSRQNLSFLPQPGSQALSSEARSFFEDRYQLIFTESETDEFIENLVSQYAASIPETGAAPLSLKKAVILFQRNEADSQLVQLLTNHLHPWIKRGALELWHQDMPFAGDTDQETRRRISEADAVLPILSADFWSDENIHNHWLPEALQQQRERGLRILPVLHRACDVEGSELAGLPILPDAARPVRNWNDEDAALKTIVDQLKKLLYD